MHDFTGKRAIVTAGGSGIARRIAERLHEAGASVFAGDVDQAALGTLPDGIGYAFCNVADQASTDAFFDQALTALNGVDILINAAGIKGPTGAIEDVDPAEWRACVDVNLTGAFHCMRRVLGPMKEQGSGSVINFSSTAGLFGYPNRSPYCAAKWAIIGMTKGAAAEAGPFNVRVNALCPGAVEGERMDRVIRDEAATTGKTEEQVRADYVKDTSMRCFVTADDMAETVMFLCSDAGARISGQAIPVDGHTSML
ncbi:SDR family oxidoreductase [Rhodospirillaceae bacterium KN72]|uniref:SDR family oxidoreductase n=1 Tax=Pacificispira spongiicola TaxID=2729598 RepID=A0A7Y0DYY7_9PROT|nr:SDR family oxidoreductase [Pacificispira spongiicola]NMM44170.1 SDR family oxidoreductase [Pacificispira spongiicola]